MFIFVIVDSDIRKTTKAKEQNLTGKNNKSNALKTHKTSKTKNKMKNLLNDTESRLLCELDGWKLLEIEKGKRIITSNGVIKDIFKNYFYYTEGKFKEDVVRGWIWIDVECYSGYIEDGIIKTEKRKKQVKSNKFDLFKSTHHHSPDSVKNALAPVLEKANDKYMQFSTRLIALQKELDVDISFFMEGDTYGIHNSGLIVTFDIDKVHCRYNLDNQ